MVFHIPFLSRGENFSTVVLTIKCVTDLIRELLNKFCDQRKNNDMNTVPACTCTLLKTLQTTSINMSYSHVWIGMSIPVLIQDTCTYTYMYMLHGAHFNLYRSS